MHGRMYFMSSYVRIPTKLRWSMCSSRLAHTKMSTSTALSMVLAPVLTVRKTTAFVAYIQSPLSQLNNEAFVAGHWGCIENVKWLRSEGDVSSSTSMQKAFVWNVTRNMSTAMLYQNAIHHDSGAGCGLRTSATSMTQITGRTLKKSVCVSSAPQMLA